jgi:hypothetical protein
MAGYTRVVTELSPRGNPMRDLLTTIGPSLLLTRIALLPSLGEVTHFELQTVAQGKTTAIASARFNAWNFAIDNVTFNASASTQEPPSLLLLNTGQSQPQRPPIYRLMETHPDASRKLIQ